MIDGQDWKDTLTPREAECLRLVLVLHTNDAIARELDLSTNTVRNHMKAARDKLGGLGRYEAAHRYASLSPGSGPSRTSPGRTMAELPYIDPDAQAVRTSDGSGRSTFREPRAVYAHDERTFEEARINRADYGPEPARKLLALLAVPALAAVIALLIVATPPMAESFKHLADAVVPLFR